MFVSRLATLHDVFIYKYISYFVVSCFLGGILHDLLVLQNDFLRIFSHSLLWVHQKQEGVRGGIGQTSRYKFRVGLLHVSTVCLFQKGKT